MKVPAWFTFVSLAAVGVLAFLLVSQCEAARAAKAEAFAVREQRTLDAAGIQSARKETEEALRRGNLLADALGDALRKAGVKGKVIATASGSTGPVIVGGEALVGPPPPAPSAAPAQAPEVTPSTSGVGPACLLHVGERAEIRASAAVAETNAGNVAVKAQADAYALNPERRLFGGELHLDAKFLSPQVPGSRTAGWGSGLAMTLGRRGWAWGPVIASPPLSLWRLQMEPTAAITLGAGGEWTGVAQVVGRWR